MTGLTVAERILVHLSRFIGRCDEYSAPADVSQNGISSAARISRAHAAIELKKLKEAGLISEGLAHIKGSRSRRKVYELTPAGRERAGLIEHYASEAGIDVSSILDLARCDPELMWDSLDEAERASFGLACVFRNPFDPAVLGEAARMVPLNDDGLADVPANMRSRIPELMDPASRRSCHSMAADHCLRAKDYAERLHHLVRAGRGREAAMLISSRGASLLEAGDGLNDTLVLLEEVPEKYRGEVDALKAKAAMAAGDADRSRSIIEGMLEGPDRRLGLILEGELLALEGDLDSALGSLLSARGPGIDTELECRIADLLCEQGRHQESIDALEALLARSAEDGSYDRADLVLLHLGKSLLRSGRCDEAVKTLSKGMGMAPEDGRQRWHLLLGEAYQAAGVQDRASEHFRLGR